MTLGNALQIGRTGLSASQAAIEVAGNNLANAATVGYHRQRIDLAPLGDQQISRNAFIGRGVQVQAIVRQVNEALEGRLRNSISGQYGSAASLEVLSQIEGIQNELTDNDISSRLAAFFDAWSELANAPDSFAQRSLVVQEGTNLATYFEDQRAKLGGLRSQVDKQIDDATRSVNDLLNQVESLNTQIARVERSNGGAHSLRDQRDVVLNQLAEYIDFSVAEKENGTIDVFVGSTPIVLNGLNRGVEIRNEEIDGVFTGTLVVKDDGTVLNVNSGQLGGLVYARDSQIADAISSLDAFAANVIYQVNRIHSQGQGNVSFDSIIGSYSVEDAAAVLNSAAAGLAFAPEHGSFQINVTQKSTGERVTSTIDIDLDGLNGDDTTLQSLVAQLNGVANISASITSDGKLAITADSNDISFSFSDDSSGLLTALGINTFFTGSSAYDIDVSAKLKGDPDFVASGIEHIPGDNRNALAIAGLRTKKIGNLGGISLTDRWSRNVEDFATRLGQARLELETNTAVRENLFAQQQAVSGVNTDEEAINLMSFQRAYQASARFLSVVDEMMQTLLSIF